jgi:hypothetical protein
MEARLSCFCIAVYETRPVNNSQYFLLEGLGSVGVLPSWAVLLAPWWSREEAIPYVGSGAGFAGTG